MRRFSNILILSLTLIVVLSGCSVNNQAEQQEQQEQKNHSQNSSTSYPITVVDDTGSSVTIPAKPERIVSLLPSSTEILCALDHEPVAVTQWDDYPEGIKERAEYVFWNALDPNLEQIINLQPDLIMYWMSSEADMNKIKSLGIPVIVFEAKNIEGVYDNIAKIGEIIDCQQQASLLIERMKDKEKRILEKVEQLPVEQKRKVWLEVDSNLFTAGSGTFLDELITKAGGINIAGNVQGWVQLNSEQIIASNPDVILESYSYMNKQIPEDIKNRQGWENIEAVKNNRVISLDNNIISRQGPRIIDGLELIAKSIYPELFEED